MTEQPEEGTDPPMTAEPIAPEQTEPPFPVDHTGIPVPPPPTPEERAERERRYREDRDRYEQERASSSEGAHALAVKGAKEALARLLAAEEERLALPEEERRAPRGIPGHEYEFADPAELTASKLAAWEADLATVRNTEDAESSVTTWRIPDIEDPNHRAIMGRFIAQLRGGKKRNCIVVGSVGAGKTATALAGGHAAVEAGIGARYVSHVDYLAALRHDSSPPGGLTKHQYRSAFVNAPLLVLDDLCAGMDVDAPATEFARRETVALLNERIMRGRPNIITTNLTTAQVATVIDDRLASRIGMNAVVLVMVGRDRRGPVKWDKDGVIST